MSDSLTPHGLQPARLCCPWNFPGKNTGVGCHFLLQGIQGIFPAEKSNSHPLCLLHCSQIPHLLSHLVYLPSLFLTLLLLIPYEYHSKLSFWSIALIVTFGVNFCELSFTYYNNDRISHVQYAAVTAVCTFKLSTQSRHQKVPSLKNICSCPYSSNSLPKPDPGQQLSWFLSK